MVGLRLEKNFKYIKTIYQLIGFIFIAISQFINKLDARLFIGVFFSLSYRLSRPAHMKLKSIFMRIRKKYIKE